MIFKKKIIYLAILVILCIGIVFTIYNKKKHVAMPEGFEGAYLEMPIEEFLKIRPKANVSPMDRYTSDQKVDLTKPNQSLEELVENDPLFGLNMAGMYSIRDEKLKQMLLIWAGDTDSIEKHRKIFVLSCIKRWGSNFQKKAFRLRPESEQTQLAPLLLWEKGNTKIAVVCTVKHENIPLKQGAFEVCVFAKDDAKSSAAFAGEKVDQVTVNNLFKNIGID